MRDKPLAFSEEDLDTVREQERSRSRSKVTKAVVITGLITAVATVFAVDYIHTKQQLRELQGSNEE